MKKTIASLLTALAMVVALVLPMASFAATLSDGEYAVDYTIVGNGTTKLVEPARLVIEEGKTYARLAWNDPEVDKLILDGETYLPIDYTKSHNIQGKLPVFLIPVTALGEDQTFEVHTRGVNLEIDTYTLNMKDYDADFDADAQAEAVQKDISGAQPVKFYKWKTGQAFSVWGPFAFLAIEAIAIAAWIKLKED